MKAHPLIIFIVFVVETMLNCAIFGTWAFSLTLVATFTLLASFVICDCVWYTPKLTNWFLGFMGLCFIPALCHYWYNHWIITATSVWFGMIAVVVILVKADLEKQNQLAKKHGLEVVAHNYELRKHELEDAIRKQKFSNVPQYQRFKWN